MVDFTIEKISKLMKVRENIRNISVIAHVDHGKSTLSDSLVAAAGIISIEHAGTQRIMDTRDDEQERCITIKSTGISLYYNIENENKDEKIEYLVNLIDSPGHIDFSSEVTAALRITDGALVVVDCIEEVCVQTETVLRQALSERIIPTLTINKLDRCFIELSYNGEDAYKSFLRVIENVNIIITTYHDEAIGRLNLDPIKLNVVFSSGIHGWAFSLNKFAKLYSKKLKIDEKKFMEKLWGDNYFDQSKKKWTKKKSEKNVIRGFVKYCYEPINVLLKKCIEEKYSDVELICKKLKLAEIFKKSIVSNKGKMLMKKIMQEWLPAHDDILRMIIDHLPSPVQSQSYRTEIIYEGPIDDKYSKAMKNCDPDGPLMLYVSKMIPNFERSRFMAFGRVFSGKVFPGLKVKVMGSNFIMGTKKDLFFKSIPRIILCMGRKFETIDLVPAGNTVAVVGLDECIVKNATVTEERNTNSYPIKAMKFSVHPVVRRAINTKNPNDLPKLLDGLNKLSRSDPMIQCITEDNGEHIIAGAGELHLEICLKDLREDFMKGVELETSDPIVPYRETVIDKSDHVCMTKSANKHNRLYAYCFPLQPSVSKAIDEGSLNPNDLKKGTLASFIELLEWSKSDCKKIWSFGPFGTGPNFLIDSTKSIQYLEEIKDSCVSAFQTVCKNGILMGENLRSLSFNLSDAYLHSDSIHRGGGQIIPSFKRVLYSCFLCSKPRLMEPIFLVNINVPQGAVGGVYTVVSARRGRVTEETTKVGNPIVSLKALLPVSESFGFTDDLRAATSGQAFPQCLFDHWKLVDSNPFELDSYSNKIIISYRKRKGMDQLIPRISDLEDKL
uniref:Translation elongation factor EF2 n=1 Tax=Amorphochlora amoebiformis TaxID=1561963 RepID=A0A0H5BLG9_9EUKA|nr:translation elongation factor EF2 [Amorphochlora amoebiformis]|mmetsp:Transcript_2677/g.3940  ORF Transcript_2677/g.3940 Transcript_2677/m.3940 type:complete len:839 (+) Transcript_2677:184-2700(+)